MVGGSVTFRGLPAELRPGTCDELTATNMAGESMLQCSRCQCFNIFHTYVASCKHVLCQDCVFIYDPVEDVSEDNADSTPKRLVGKCGKCMRVSPLKEFRLGKLLYEIAKYRCACGHEGTLKELHDSHCQLLDAASTTSLGCPDTEDVLVRGALDNGCTYRASVTSDHSTPARPSRWKKAGFFPGSKVKQAVASYTRRLVTRPIRGLIDKLRATPSYGSTT